MSHVCLSENKLHEIWCSTVTSTPMAGTKCSPEMSGDSWSGIFYRLDAYPDVQPTSLTQSTDEAFKAYSQLLALIRQTLTSKAKREEGTSSGPA